MIPFSKRGKFVTSKINLNEHGVGSLTWKTLWNLKLGTKSGLMWNKVRVVDSERLTKHLCLPY